MHDIIIVGAGVTGCFIARELARYKLNVLVLEKNNDVGNETTSANSAIVHSGYDPVPGTLKAKLNVEGNAMFDAWRQPISDSEVLADVDLPFRCSVGEFVDVEGNRYLMIYNRDFLEKREFKLKLKKKFRICENE